MTDSRGTDSYFTDFRKGEVNELLEAMRSAHLDKTGMKVIETIKKVVAYMTMGIDVSRLFPEMVMATNTTNLVQKKLVYLYLCNNAENHPDLSVLAVNTLLKDFRDENPMVRGLALRSLCSLRLPNLADHIFASIQSGLGDMNPYVRKTAVLGCAKLFYIAPHRVRESGIISKLYEMLRDKDAHVVANCVCSLNEILAEEGGVAINQPIAYHLLNRLREFNEWHVCVIAEAVEKYTPTEDETYDMMNILEEKLRTPNSAVIFSVIKLFLKFSTVQPQIQQQVYERLKTPILTLLGTQSPELAFAILHHVLLMIGRAPAVFENDFKTFFCRSNDPSYVKQLKIQILRDIVAEKNKYDLIAELSEYATDMDVEVARAAVRALGQIAVRVPDVTSHTLEKLFQFLEQGHEHTVGVTLCALKDVLRAYPEQANAVIPEVKKCLKTVDDVDAKAAVVWMLGQYGEVIPESPYLLESLIETWTDEPPPVRLQLLTACMKLFFKRPPECQPILGALLARAVADSSDVDVHDRALFYHRLLSQSVDGAERVVNAAKLPVQSFVEDEALVYKDQLFEEFNSLSVLFGKPSEMFLRIDAAQPAAQQQAEQAAADSEGDGVAYEDENGGGDGGEEGAASDEPLELVLQPALDRSTFQARWAQFPERQSFAFQVSAVPPPSLVETQMANRRVRCAASGSVKDDLKFYFYAQDQATGAYFLAELLVKKSALSAAAKFRGENEIACAKFAEYFEAQIRTVMP